MAKTFSINGRSLNFYHADFEVGCGGDELPMEYDRKHYLYVWNKKKKIHAYYCFEDDLFIDEKDSPFRNN